MWSRALFCVAIAVSTPLAWARDAWPARPIRMVVPYPPGALTDTLARAVTERIFEFR